jgi:HEAT repeat protein
MLSRPFGAETAANSFDTDCEAPMTPEQLAALVAKFPAPAARDGKLADVDKAATDQALAELQRGGREAVVGLVALIDRPAPLGNQARHALHALATAACGPKDEARRRAVAEALASTLGGDRPRDVRAFVVRQLQLVGGREVAPALGKLLLDESLCDDAAQALVAIKDGAGEPLRAALPKATGRAKVTIAQALGELRDQQAAAALKPLVTDSDRDVRLAAGWALARAGDATAVDLLLKAAEADGYERIKATQACLLLAENLLAAGRKQEAMRVYKHLHETRTDRGEQHVRDAAARGLAAAGQGR